MFYNGADIGVHAVVPRGAEIAIVCIGKREEVSFSQKGKVFGFIWMNVGEVVFADIPSTYLLNTSAPLERLGSSELLADLGLGYSSLERDQRREPEDEGNFFHELVRLKESEGLYGVSESAITTAGSDAGGTAFDTEFHLPAKSPPGSYRIILYGFTPEGGKLLAEKEVRLEQVGSAAFISNLGEEHGLMYGILAVIIAIGVGLFTGVAFGLGSKGGH
jgi:uncharacterized protein (TIGR02186 family)